MNASANDMPGQPTAALGGRHVALLAGALLLGMLTAPFLLPFARPPFTSFHQEWLAIALGLAAFSLFLLARPMLAGAVPHIALMPVALAALIALQAAFGSVAYWQQGALASLILVWAALMVVLGHNLRRQWGWRCFVMLCAAGLAAGALLNAAIALLQLAGWFPAGWVARIEGTRLYGNLAQANHLANYLFLGLISLGYLAAVRQLPAWIAVSCALPLLLTLTLTGSRSIWLYFAAAIVLAVWNAWRAKDAQLRGLAVATVLALATCVALSLPWTSAGMDAPAVSETALARMQLGDGGLEIRLHMWLAALEMFRASPLTGVGFGQYAWQHFLLAETFPTAAAAGLTDNAHNIVLHLLAEFGIAGLLILLAGVGVWLFRQDTRSPTAERWWLLAVLSVLAIHSLLEYPLWYAYFLGVFALLAGAGAAGAWQMQAGGRVFLRAAVVLAAWFVVVQVAWDYRRIESLAGRPAIDVRQDIEALHRGSLLSHVVELGMVTAMPLDAERAGDKLVLSGRVLRWIPAGDLAFRHSILLALSGDAASAKAFWDRSALAYPGETSAALNLLRKVPPPRSAAGDELLEYAASRGGES
ncbi:MAG TPA: Wzy polymerase domain-containing protein [Burkholderiales bacterium]|nr:Wzy polymerase domain-containing protein [Burkholderiales bacterium]